MKPAAVLLATIAAAAAAAAATATTQPSQAILVNVNITDKGIRTSMFHTSGPRSNDYWAAFYATRGEVAYFVVRNAGKKPHNFTILGKKTKAIRPGGRARFQVALTRRGTFPFESTMDRGKKGFRGQFRVA